MPEGPSIVILKEEIAQFAGKKVVSAHGNAKIAMDRLEGQKIVSFGTWGKHLLICFTDFTVRIHLLMFGTYLINERKTTPLKLGLEFDDSELNFYTVNVKLLEGKINDHYDWSADVMNDKWDARKAKLKLKDIPNTIISDALLEQDIFSGVGNIIKNEVLYRVRVHPNSVVSKIPSRKMTEIMKEAQTYSFEFLKWKKKGELKRNWEAYTKKKCKRCDLPMQKEYTGTKKRRSFFCPNCQKLYI